MKAKTVLILDDDPTWRRQISRIVEGEAMTAIACATLSEACKKIDDLVASHALPDIVFADALERDPDNGEVINYCMANDLFAHIRKITGKIPINFYMITTHVSKQDKAMALSMGVPIIKKDECTIDDITRILRECDAKEEGHD